jgi:D-alanyl-D-alanine carboxypeptidase (penicillin-binding protein 5/6)
VTRRAVLLTALALVLGAVPGTAAHAALPRPEVRAPSAIVVDARTGEVLLRKDPTRERAIASATKLMTALLALERADLDDTFPAARYSALPVESKINLRTGERMKVRDLLRALLLESANDAAVTIAENVAGSRAAFVRQMNERARELGLSETSFANPIGLDDPDNHSSARDLARLAARLMRNPTFRGIVDMAEVSLDSGSRPRTIDNRNKLIARYPFMDGVKTGHTRGAGYVLVGSATGRAGVRVISVVLGDASEAARDADTLALLRWGIDQYRRVTVVRPGRTLARAGVRFYDDREAALTASRPVVLTVRRGERPRVRVNAPDELEGAMPAGRRVGTVRVVSDGRVVARRALITRREVPGAGPLRQLTAGIGATLTFAAALAILALAVLGALRLRSTRRRRVSSTTRTR